MLLARGIDLAIGVIHTTMHHTTHHTIRCISRITTNPTIQVMHAGTDGRTGTGTATGKQKLKFPNSYPAEPPAYFAGLGRQCTVTVFDELLVPLVVKW